MSRILVLTLAALVLLAGIPALAQNVISAKAGIVQLAEGEVFLNGKQIQPKVTEFPEIKAGATLATEAGRAEILLAPGEFLRIGEDSAIRMDSTALADVRLTLTKGVAVLEVVEYATGARLAGSGRVVNPYADTPDALKAGALTLTLRDATVLVRKAGIYRFDAASGDMRVYAGELAVAAGGGQWTLKDGKTLTASDGGWTAGKFDVKDTDPLYRWAKRRSGYVAMANVAAARSAGGSSVFGYSGGVSRGWIFNPYLGMYTFIPNSGLLYSPFGWAYYTPRTVIYAYTPAYNQGGGSGYNRGGPATATFDSSVGYSVAGRGITSAYSGGNASSSAPAAAASAPAASAPAAGSRGGTGNTGGRR